MLNRLLAFVIFLSCSFASHAEASEQVDTTSTPHVETLLNKINKFIYFDNSDYENFSKLSTEERDYLFSKYNWTALYGKFHKNPALFGLYWERATTYSIQHILFYLERYTLTNILQL